MKVRAVQPKFQEHGGVLPVAVVGYYRWVDPRGWFAASQVSDVIFLDTANEESYRLTLETGIAHFPGKSGKPRPLANFKIVRVRIDTASGGLVYYAENKCVSDLASVLEMQGYGEFIECEVAEETIQDTRRRYGSRT